jgi:PAS domain S-box-containing protein
MRDYIRRLLGHHYDVTAVADGEAALREIQQFKPDLVLTDVMMPRCDGFQLLQALRANPATRGIPVVMLSARAGEESRIEGLQAGADDYLIKPFSARELLARVQARLELARLRAAAASDIAQANQHLRISEERFRLVSRATNDVIWDWDLATGRALWNEAVRASFGYAPEEMGATAELWYERIHPEERDRVVHGVHAAIDGGAETWQDEYRFLCKDGAYRVFFDRGFIARHGDGKAYRMIGSMQDVTEQKRAEQRLEAAVVERTARLRETIAELEAFSYSISHDMRGPLRAMQGYARALLEDAGPRLSSAEQQYLSRIARAAQRLDRLIRDVLDYSRLAKTRVVLEPIDVEKLIDEIVQQYPALQSPEVQVDIETPLHTVLGHEVLLTQCLSNLLGNAVKFVAPGTSPRVRVRTEPCGQDVRLWVEDSGIGIAPHNHNRVFGIFQRINPDAAYEGTGIGLAIVRKAAERMVGEVGVESQLGAGSRFWIRLRKAGA